MGSSGGTDNRDNQDVLAEINSATSATGSKGGPTDLDNLVLVCSTHHKLVHEHSWGVSLGPPGIADWFRPDGSRFRPDLIPGRAWSGERVSTA